MLNENTMTKLQEMHLTVMAKTLREQLSDPNMNSLSFEDRIGLLVDAEWTSRKNNHLKRLIKNAGFADTGACIENIEYHSDRNLDKAQIARLATCSYISERHNVMLLGATGSGKTYLACALGMAAARNFFSVKYIRLPELLVELSIARNNGTFPKVMQQFKKPFNTSTILSYNTSLNLFKDKVQIFMSATMDGMKNLLNEGNYSEYIDATEKGTDTLIKQHRLTSDFFKQYSIDADYSYVNLKYIHDESEIPQLIKNTSKEKWLIFVDTVAAGSRLERDIINSNKKLKNNIVFINSKYEYDESALESFEELSEENLISKKVVIATAELDNGVSFVDESLRNIVILCDNEEEFIQMLGRKRKDSHSINLYITKRDIAYFKRRRQEIRKTLDYYSNYEYKVINSSQFNIYRQEILDEILHNNFALHHFKKFVCVFNGNLNINYISINRLYSLQDFYNQIIDELESDCIAFLKRQAGWIGVDSDKLNEIIQEANKQYKESLKKELKNHVDQSLDDDSREKFIDDIKPFLLALVTEENGFDSDYIKTVKGYLTKSDRVLTLDHFNTIMSHPNIDLNYQMIKEDKNYIIKPTSNK